MKTKKQKTAKLSSSKRITIRDIARIAGVSHTTVSRALNDSPNIRAETKDRILRIIKEMNYRPDVKARGLAMKRSGLIGLVVSDISNPFYAEVARGIEDKAHEKGYNVIFCSTDNEPGRTETYVKVMMEIGVDGLVFASARLHEPMVEKLIAERFPVVLVNRKLKGKGFNHVVLDNVRGAYELTAHLIKLGYRKIALIVGPSNLSTGIERLKGYQKALKDYGVEPSSKYVYHGPFTKATGYEGAKALLTMKERPEAIFGGNDCIAMGVIDAVEELGLRIPHDVAVVGFDDTDFASNRRIKLTTIGYKKYEMGSIGVQILIDHIERRGVDYVHRVVLEPKLVIRESCGYQLKKGPSIGAEEGAEVPCPLLPDA